MRTENLIELVQVKGLWYALYAGPHADEIYKAFGTVLLPTPYSTSVSAEKVCNIIGQKNRGVTIQCDARLF